MLRFSLANQPADRGEFREGQSRTKVEHFFGSRRAEIPISRAGLPGHFLIRHGLNFFAPFHGWARVGLDECRARVAQHGLTLTASTLQPFPAPQFLARMLNNLHAIAEESDPPLAVKIARWIDEIAQ